MQNSPLNTYLANAWLELPYLVERFVQRVAPALHCSLPQLRDVISEDLELAEYENLSRVCRMMSQIYELLQEVHSGMDLEYAPQENPRVGLAAAIVSAWHGSEESMGGIQYVDERNIEPMPKLPWRVWAVWLQRESGDALKNVKSQDKDNFGVEDAYEILQRFMSSCQEWRQNILDSYTIVNEGTPLGLNALDAAEQLINEVCDIDPKDFELRLSTFISARGFYGSAFTDFRQSLDRTVSPENLKLDGGSLKRHIALLGRMENGESVIQVRQLREHHRWYKPELVDGAYEDGPCMWQMLAHVNDEAYVEISEGEDFNVAQRSICPYRTVYVEKKEDIPSVLRCTGLGATEMHTVTKTEALKEGLPQIAGWYAIQWWE